MRARRGDRGATLLEFALVLPVLLLLAFGTAEVGLAWVANNQVEGAVSTAARIGASSGSGPMADTNILVSLRSSLSAEALANLDRVVIFKPSNDDGGIPAGCIKPVGSINEVGQAGACNSYRGATVRTITATTDLGTLDDYWRPATRKDRLSGPPDDVGVWVRTRHDQKTGTYFGDFTITKTSIYRIQPDASG